MKESGQVMQEILNTPEDIPRDMLIKGGGMRHRSSFCEKSCGWNRRQLRSRRDDLPQRRDSMARGALRP